MWCLQGPRKIEYPWVFMLLKTCFWKKGSSDFRDETCFLHDYIHDYYYPVRWCIRRSVGANRIAFVARVFQKIESNTSSNILSRTSNAVGMRWDSEFANYTTNSESAALRIWFYCFLKVFTPNSFDFNNFDNSIKRSYHHYFYLCDHGIIDAFPRIFKLVA